MLSFKRRNKPFTPQKAKIRNIFLFIAIILHFISSLFDAEKFGYVTECF